MIEIKDTQPKVNVIVSESNAVNTNYSNVLSDNNESKKYETNSYTSTGYSSMLNYLELNVLTMFNSNTLADMVANPMYYNKELRDISEQLYSYNGLYTQCVDYCTSLPTLDYWIIAKCKAQSKKKKYKELTENVLNIIHHKEIIRDALFKLMIDGVCFYYVEFSNPVYSAKKTLTDTDISEIIEINNSQKNTKEEEINISVLTLPIDYTRIIQRKNSSYQIAFNLDYFDQYSGDERNRKVRSFPKEIREAYERHRTNATDYGNWVILDNNKTIVSKIRSKIEEPYGRPLCLGAIKDMLYQSYYKDTKRSQLDEMNNRVFVQTFPEGTKQGNTTLSDKQQKNQHETVKNAILTKNTRSSTAVVSVAGGTKLEQIKVDTSIFDEKNESNLNDDIGLDLGFMANLVSARGSGNFSSQVNNLNLLMSEIFMWIEPIQKELEKVINKNLINDKNCSIGIYYLPCSIITRESFTKQMKELYLQGKGSLTAWIASTGINSDAYFSLMDYELEEDFEHKYPVHQTSFNTAGGKDNQDPNNKGGAPITDHPTDSTLKNRDLDANNLPSPSDNK